MILDQSQRIRICLLLTAFLFSCSPLLGAETDQVREGDPLFLRSGEVVELPDVCCLESFHLLLSPDQEGRFTMPTVRAPVLLEGLDRRGVKRLELILYPPRTSQSASNASPRFIEDQLAPDWFRQWGIASGFFDASPLRCPRNDLLVLGESSAGERPEDALAVAKQRHATVVLVLQARWYGPKQERRIDLAPCLFTGSFLDRKDLLGNKEPISFPFRYLPSPLVMNRFGDSAREEGMPFLEELFLDDDIRFFVSYLPWQWQLGRSEQTEMIFRNILSALVSEFQHPPGAIPSKGIDLLWPREWEIQREKRPVLYTALQQRSSSETVPILDVRGKNVQKAKYRNLLRQLEREPHLILGTDPGLKLPSLRKKEILCIEEDEIPPSRESRYRLMEMFTRLEIRLY